MERRTRKITLDKDFKEAISALTHREKDKLLFRLLTKEPELVEKLRFELLEDGEGVEERRGALANKILQTIRRNAPHFYSPGYLLLDLRSYSGRINRHVKTTKDKYGEIYLNLLMLLEVLRLHRERVAEFSPEKARTFCEYVVKRIMKIFKLLRKQHEDVALDFREELQTLGHYFGEIDGLLRVSNHYGFDVNYLLHGQLPADDDDFWAY